MQKSQVGQFFIVAVVVFVSLIVLALFLALTMQIGSTAFLEMAWNWLLRLVGLTTVIFGLISFLTAGPMSLSPERFSRWIAIILLGLLIVHLNWALALSLAGLLIAMMVISCLRRSGAVDGTGQ